MKKHISIVFGLVFFLFIIACTIFSRMIHDSRLPKVSIQSVKHREFSISYNLEDGTEVTTKQRKLAIPMDIVHEGAVYVLREREHYDETETYVELVYVEIGQIEGEFVEVKNGLSSNDKLIVDSDRPFEVGQAVLVRGD